MGYGYVVPDGYIGTVGQNSYMLFATEQDYKDYIEEWKEPIQLEYRKNVKPAFIFKRKKAFNG